jgi:hypothetical protein
LKVFAVLLSGFPVQVSSLAAGKLQACAITFIAPSANACEINKPGSGIKHQEIQNQRRQDRGDQQGCRSVSSFAVHIIILFCLTAIINAASGMTPDVVANVTSSITQYIASGNACVWSASTCHACYVRRTCYTCHIRQTYHACHVRHAHQTNHDYYFLQSRKAYKKSTAGVQTNTGKGRKKEQKKRTQSVVSDFVSVTEYGLTIFFTLFSNLGLGIMT